jgi:hypothetical protein
MPGHTSAISNIFENFLDDMLLEPCSPPRKWPGAALHAEWEIAVPVCARAL